MLKDYKFILADYSAKKIRCDETEVCLVKYGIESTLKTQVVAIEELGEEDRLIDKLLEEVSNLEDSLKKRDKEIDGLKSMLDRYGD